MAVVSVGVYQALWNPSGDTARTGSGTLILRDAGSGDLHRIENLGAQDFQVMLGMLQNERPLFWDTDARHLRTSHAQSAGAEPVGEQEGT
ncbi:MAG TPA: hypothetical protein VF263_06800 [Longimicrobiaceae bacterium]